MAQGVVSGTYSRPEIVTGPRESVAIIGAGPYGLAAAAHLRAAGVDTKVFGEPMVFWREKMPAGMLLRSGWDATHIADPHNALTLDRFVGEQQLRGIHYPVPLEVFVAYGEWFQRRAVPDVDTRRVSQVNRDANGFTLKTEDGEVVRASRVVVAAGISLFARWPHQFVGLPKDLVSHTSDHTDLGIFRGKSVAVVGGGQSALETTALLREMGADVEVLMRNDHVVWARPKNFLKSLPRPYQDIFYPPTDVGPILLSWLVALPHLFRMMPREYQDRLARRSIRPLGANWLRHRVDGLVPITTGVKVARAETVGGRVRLGLSDGSSREFDHVILGTGYRVDVNKYPFLSQELLTSLRQADGYPILRPGYESSITGLHFLGAPAAWSFGPLMRFVSGAGYTSRALTARVTRTNGVRVSR